MGFSVVFVSCSYIVEYAFVYSVQRRQAEQDRVGDLTLFGVPTGGAFDRLNWQHSGEFDPNFSKKSNAPWFSRGDGGFWD